MDPVIESFIKKLTTKDKTGRNLFYHSIKDKPDVVSSVSAIGSTIPFIARRQKVIGGKWAAMSPKEKEKWNARAKKENDAKKLHNPQNVYQ